jgi:hydroxymethylpyrimidine/phosphomethylpyrimidine kinase
MGVYGMAVAATLTVQSTKGMYGRHDVDPPAVREQLEALFSDRRPNAVKTGALATRDIIVEVAYILKKEEYPGPLVIDPVIASGDGQSLLDKDGVKALVDLLVPHATLVTPNVDEVPYLCGFDVFDVKDLEAAALRLVAMGARAALVTGGRTVERGGEYAVDVFCDGREMSVMKSPWMEGERIHGTGCVLSAAITAGLALGKNLKSAVNDGRRLVRASMENAVKPGHGVASANPYATVRLRALGRMKGGRHANRLHKRYSR